VDVRVETHGGRSFGRAREDHRPAVTAGREGGLQARNGRVEANDTVGASAATAGAARITHFHRQRTGEPAQFDDLLHELALSDDEQSAPDLDSGRVDDL
jgi:hypothetical protein